MTWKWRQKPPIQEHIRQVAEEIYQNRLLLNRPGNAHSDWVTAEKIVQSPLRMTLFKGHRPFVKLRQPTQQVLRFIVWDTPGWLLFSLPKLEWMKLLAVPLAIAAAGSIITGQIQREANQNAILKEYLDQLNTLIFERGLLSSMPGDGSRLVARGRTVIALKELDLERRQQLITFLDASGLLRPNDVPKGRIITNSFDHSGNLPAVISFAYQDLSGINLEGIDFFYVSFEGADLSKTNLSKAWLANINFSDANLNGANLQESILVSSDLLYADLSQANLRGAKLWGSNFEDAYFFEADLSEAGVNQDQLTQAQLCRTKFPSDITLDPNRDCEALGIVPETGKQIGP